MITVMRGAGDRVMSCLRTSVTNLYQDIGDTTGVFGGDTSALRLESMLRRWLPMNPLTPVSGSRSRSGPMMRLGAQ